MDFTNLDKEIYIKTARSGGKGGQNVNKVETKILLEFHVNNSNVLTGEQKGLLWKKLAPRINADGILQVVAQSERTQLGNKKVALDKFHDLVESALRTVKKRKQTTVPKAEKVKRVQAKKMRSELKKMRRKID